MNTNLFQQNFKRQCVLPPYRNLLEISKGEGVVETEGGSQLFETAEKGGGMKNGPLKGGGLCKYVSVIMRRFTHIRKKKFFIL